MLAPLDLVRRQEVGRVEALPFVGRQVEPEDVLGAHGLGPDLAVDVVAQPREVQLHGVVVAIPAGTGK